MPEHLTDREGMDVAETTDVRWPKDWWAAQSWFVDGKREGSAVVHSPTSGYGFPVTVYIPTNSDGRPDLDGLLARLRLDPAEVEALRWLAKVVESSETWLKSKSGLQPKAILSALDKWRRVSGE